MLMICQISLFYGKMHDFLWNLTSILHLTEILCKGMESHIVENAKYYFCLVSGDPCINRWKRMKSTTEIQIEI